MKQIPLLILAVLSLCFKFSISQTIHTNFDDFKSACQSATPGDEIILASGRYQAESITISDVKGTEKNPVIIRAETIGGDTLDAGTYFDLRHCSYIIIQGFVINITEKSTTFKIQTCNNIRLTQNTLNGEGENYYNDENERNSSVWVSIQSLWDDEEGLSHHNQIDHNIFINKHTLGNMIKIDGTNDLYVSQYDIIEYNYFKNMGPRADNEMEAIRIGWSEMSQSDGFCKVENNLFEECNGDPEIISVKCNKNTIAHNTFRRCQGTLSLRHGNESLIDGNFFLGEGAEGTGGVRIYGSDHRIINNYFEGLTGTKWDAPITLTEGDAEEGDGGLSNHFRIERAIIANNTLINNTHGIEVGFDNNGKYSKPPRDVVLANNIVQADTNTIVTYLNQPDNIQWVNNIFYPINVASMGNGVSFIETEAQNTNPFIKLDNEQNIYKSTTQTQKYSPNNELVGTISYDMEGQPRLTPTNYGADELSDATILYKPLDPSDVGPAVGKYLYLSTSAVQAPVTGVAVTVSISSNLNWEVLNDSSWLSFTPTSGSGYDDIVLTVLENTTGKIRNTTVIIQSTNGQAKDKIIRKINIIQAEIETPTLSVNPSELTFSSTIESAKINVTSNVSWGVTTEESWISIDPASGINNGEFTITSESNESVASRKGTIIVSGLNNLSEKITLTQQGNTGSEEKLSIINATASSEQTAEGNVAANVFDGILTNRWSGDGDGTYITLELEETSIASYLKVGLYKGDERSTSFDILTSVNGTDFFDALMGITSEITDEALVIYNFQDTTTKYVRIVGHGNSTSSWNSFTEFEVWGWLKGNSIYNTLSTNTSVSVYPNPSTGIINLTNSQGANLFIYDMTGKLVFSKYDLAQNEKLNTTIENGIYALQISLNNTHQNLKIIVK